MKKIILYFIAIIISVNSFAQQEPKFEKDAALLNDDGSITAIPTSVGNFNMAFFVSVNGEASDFRIKQQECIKIIVKVENNSKSPFDIFRCFRMKSKKGSRKASMGAYGIKSKAFIPFTAEQYGETSFVLTFNNLEPGEYGIWCSCEDELEKYTMGDHPMTFFGIDKNE